MPGIIDNLRRHAPLRRIVLYTLPPIEIITDDPPSELSPLVKGSKIEMRCDATSVALVGKWLAAGQVRWTTITPDERLEAANAVMPRRASA